MKKLIVEDPKGGLLELLGKRVTFYCASFIYCGELIGVNDTCVQLTKAQIVYDTGSHAKKEWELQEELPHDWYIQLSAIESFGEFK